MSFYREQLEVYLSQLRIDADTVFDVGGAQGGVVDRLGSYSGRQYDVLDLPDWDLDEYWSVSKIQTAGYYQQANVVFCLEVFEYLVRPVIALQNIAQLMVEDGVAYVTFAFVYPHHNELDRDATRYTEPGILRLAKYAGLHIDSIDYRYDKSGFLKKLYAADGMRASKQYNEHDVTGFIVRFSR